MTLQRLEASYHNFTKQKKKRKEEEVKDKEASLRKRKEGPSEEMSVVLLKEV